MKGYRQMRTGEWSRAGRIKCGKVVAAAGLLGMAGACVQVSAPDKPIEIVLTINIRQEVVYRLDSDAKALIEQNTEIF